MTTLLKRGSKWHYDSSLGGRRIRISLGTDHQKTAERLANQIGCAVSEGPRSDRWTTLRLVLPPASYRAVSRDLPVPPSEQIRDFEARFYEKLDKREKLGEITDSTNDLYRGAARLFFGWLTEQGIKLISEVGPGTIEDYRLWRLRQLDESPRSTSKGTTAIDGTVLSSIFRTAVEEDLIRKSPMKFRFAQVQSVHAAKPFTISELENLLNAAREEGDELAFLLLRYTGMRRSDVALMTWDQINLDSGTLRRRTKKRRTWVVLPLPRVLSDKLRERWEETKPAQDDRVLPWISQTQLSAKVKSWGKKAGVADCHAHRFRDTLACTILEKGGTIFDVAKVLGDQVATVERHYAQFTDKLQERVREMLESN